MVGEFDRIIDKSLQRGQNWLVWLRKRLHLIVIGNPVWTFCWKRTNKNKLVWFLSFMVRKDIMWKGSHYVTLQREGIINTIFKTAVKKIRSHFYIYFFFIYFLFTYHFSLFFLVSFVKHFYNKNEFKNPK